MVSLPHIRRKQAIANYKTKLILGKGSRLTYCNNDEAATLNRHILRVLDNSADIS